MRSGVPGIDARRSRIRWRSRRRTRLRVTAPPTVRPTMKPTRAESPGGPARCTRACTTTVALPALRPLRMTAENSSRDRILAPAGNTTAGSVGLRQPGAGDPSAAGSTAPTYRRGCASAGGSRASCADAGCWAETYACSLRTAPDRMNRSCLGVVATTTVTTRFTRRPRQGQAHDSRRTQSDLKTIRSASRQRQTHAMPASFEIARGTCGQPLAVGPESLLPSRDQLGFPQAGRRHTVHILWKTVWKLRGSADTLGTRTNYDPRPS
jgi:hypothetical protein